MTIDEMQNRRAAVENRLAAVAAQLIEEFQRDTQLMVEGVSIDLVDVSTIGEPRRSLVNRVRLDIRI